MNLAHANILGINISIVDLPDLLKSIDELAQQNRPALVNNVNVHACNLAYDNDEFRDVLNESDIVFCDGYGVKLGAALCGIRLGQRMTPPDWIDDLFALSEKKGYSVYFIGDTEEVVSCFAERVGERYPGLQIAGWNDGFFDLDGPDNDRVVDAISITGADIIITGMGMPRQEFWAWEAKSQLPKGVIIATGALFRWYTGYENRAPKWITACGLEWLARLIMHPRRHFKRYVIGLPVFFWRLFFGKRK